MSYRGDDSSRRSLPQDESCSPVSDRSNMALFRRFCLTHAASSMKYVGLLWPYPIFVETSGNLIFGSLGFRYFPNATSSRSCLFGISSVELKFDQVLSENCSVFSTVMVAQIIILRIVVSESVTCCTPPSMSPKPRHLRLSRSSFLTTAIANC